MRIILTAGFLWCMLAFAAAQSPFNYGQNKQVYFISAQLRDSLSLNTIYTVDKQPEGEVGGMGENWDVELITFDKDVITSDWYPVSKDSTFRYNFDSLIADMQYLNGTRYEFSDGQLKAYGGNGYGSFSWSDITRVNDTVSIVASYCVGHCGQQPVDYSKHVFNPKGQLVYRVGYPSSGADEADGDGAEHEGEETDDIIEEGEVMTLQEYDRFLMRHVNTDHLPDTLFYVYDSKGLFLKERGGADAAEAQRLLFTEHGDMSYTFHQCYIGRMRMERFILKKLGYTPDLILLEIYRHGVLAFRLDKKSGKYYQTDTVMLGD